MTRGILLDIEGTTTPISFVFDVLFPYARRHLVDYLERNFDLAEVRADIAALNQEHAKDLTNGSQPPPVTEQDIVEYAYWLMDRNSKSTALKSLQGKIWQEGYINGELKATVFPDVRPAMERWHNAGINVSIFSSGSVLAQQLLFSHTEAGNLAELINCYFDTQVGKKTDAASYKEISRALSLAPDQIHFVSDVIAELDAASEAGMQTSLCIRPGNMAQEPNAKHETIRTFDLLVIERGQP
ncbi:MAG TPA: acireductone synthase [Pyrinomonadaceae bacterium]